MRFTQRLSAGVKGHLSNLKDMHERRVEAAEAKAKRELAEARTKTDRQKVLLKLKREKLSAKKELYEAQLATKKAKKAVEKARKEAGDLTVGERIGAFGKALYGKPKRRATRRKVRKTIKRR